MQVKGELTLAFIGSQNHKILDKLEKKYKEEASYEYVKDILDEKNINYRKYLEE